MSSPNGVDEASVEVPLGHLYNARWVNPNLLTAGQPTEDQLQEAASCGFRAVVNLAPVTSSNSLPNEGALVHHLGMKYIHIPVDWEAPTDCDFDQFAQAMRQSSGEKTLVHCAANFRASAFYSLYALKELGWTPEQAEQFRNPIWEGSDYPVWVAFISQMTDSILELGPPAG